MSESEDQQQQVEEDPISLDDLANAALGFVNSVMGAANAFMAIHRQYIAQFPEPPEGNAGTGIE